MAVGSPRNKLNNLLGIGFNVSVMSPLSRLGVVALRRRQPCQSKRDWLGSQRIPRTGLAYLSGRLRPSVEPTTRIRNTTENHRAGGEAKHPKTRETDESNTT